MKYFIITVDTEGDNLWNWHLGDNITTENSKSIPRFQELCEKYGLIPTYLTNYEMACDDFWVTYGRKKSYEGKCEIGMHIHAWNSPPDYNLKNIYGGNSYITEYPEEIMQKKVHELMYVLQNRFEMKITSNRSGRWATNDTYFHILKDEGIEVDCSVTPQLDLSKIPGCMKNCGNDYRKYPITPYYPIEGLLEVPMTTRHIRGMTEGSLKHRIKTLVLGQEFWLRPFTKSMRDLLNVTKVAEKNSTGYLEFMIHSSELLAGGSPYFKNEEEIEILYSLLENYFYMITKNGYKGIGLSDFGRKNENVKKNKNIVL